MAMPPGVATPTARLMPANAVFPVLEHESARNWHGPSPVAGRRLPCHVAM